MPKLINVKTVVVGGATLYMIWCCVKAYLFLVLEKSIDAGTGFLMGFMFAALLMLQRKCVKYLYGEVIVWLNERRARRARNYGVQR